ncbi:MAG: transposase [Desulfamplus sp.]|nr:transposase [Desulfamplus sp.]
MQDKEIAKTVVDAWKYFDGKRYDLVAYVVMPNHVHVLIRTYEGFPLSNVVHSWKSFTAHKINKYLKLCGRDARTPGSSPKVWQNEYFDRFIRDERHFVQAIAYIHENPVKAGLCHYASEWPWSSVGKCII